jgi:hypothetical protein
VPAVRLAHVLVRVGLPGGLLATCAVVWAFTFAWSPLVVAAWCVAAVGCVVHQRLGAAIVVLLSAWAFLGGHYYNHLWFLFWVALTVTIFGAVDQQRLVLRCQLSIVYGFAALAKMNPLWLSGESLASHGVRLPEALIGPAAVATVALEATLAWALWIPRWRILALAAAAPMHLSFWLMMEYPLRWSGGLLIFNLLVFGLLLWSTRRRSTDRATVDAHRRRTFAVA